jgi:CheY-like chemotaxis protein
VRASKAAPPRAKILVVDDDPDIRGLVNAILTEKGHQVIEAADGEEGLALAERDAPDLIVLDIMMPSLDGYEVCRRLANQPHTAHIPILMLTAKSSLEDIEIGLSGYADDYMTKPFQQRELVARAGALIRRTQRPKRPQRAKQDPIQQLVDRATSRGEDVYSPHVSRLKDHPPQWTGPVPDALVLRGNKRIAYWMETVESLRDEKTPSRWKALLKGKGIELRLVVTDAESHKAASSLLRRHRLNVKLLNTEPSRSGDAPRVRRTFIQIRTAIVVTVLAGFLLALLFLWGISRIPG